MEERAPRRHPNATDPKVVAPVVSARKKLPGWGPRELLYPVGVSGGTHPALVTEGKQTLV